jgi:ubiquitin-protein ligase
LALSAAMNPSGWGGKYLQRLRKDINDLLSHDFSCTSSTASVSPGESCEGFFLSLCIHDGPYRGGHFTFYLGVPDTYPFSMVQVTAVNRPIWHPNIDMDTGVVLIPLEWTPVMTAKSLLNPSNISL